MKAHRLTWSGIALVGLLAACSDGAESDPTSGSSGSASGGMGSSSSNGGAPSTSSTGPGGEGGGGGGMVQYVDCTTTLADPSPSAVQQAVDDAADGDTVCITGTLALGNSTISLSNDKGITVAGAASMMGGGVTTVTHGGDAFRLTDLTGTNTNLYRITGFSFDGGENASQVIWFYGCCGGATRVMTNIRVDHNDFQNYTDAATLIFFGENGTPGYFYGVVDHNTVTENNSVALAQMIGGGDTATAPAGTRGTENNMYFEDNTVTITTMTNSGRGCMDSWGGQSWVWRYNTSTNCLLTSHGVTHAWGPVNVEVYGSSFIVDSGAEPGIRDCYRCFHHQGSGEFLAFDNIFTAFSGKSGDALEMTHYRSAVPGAGSARCDGSVSVDGNRPGQMGYPCKRQPGRDVNGDLQPMYAWLNRWSDDGSRVPLAVENPWGATNPSVADHIAANRDYYNAPSANPQTSPTSPFNGSSGMGFGTIANRPTTCTPTPQSADGNHGGVGYWATDEGEWNDTNGSTPDGQLYRCSATNTWTLHYVPYAYPHPLLN